MEHCGGGGDLGRKGFGGGDPQQRFQVCGTQWNAVKSFHDYGSDPNIQAKKLTPASQSEMLDNEKRLYP